MAANAMHLSTSNEAYTPRNVVAAERTALGGIIDLDPASCLLANTYVQAARIYTQADDGLSKPWGPLGALGARGPLGKVGARVRCNPPGGRDGNRSVTAKWWRYGVSEWISGRVMCMTWVAFKLDFLQVTLGLRRNVPLPLDFPICYPYERLAYLTSVLPGPTAKNPKRKPTPKQLADHAATGLCTAESPPHASAIIFLPECHNGSVDLASIDRFRVAFASIGEVVCDMDRLATVMRARAIGASALPGS
jgi:hypothetical protein